MTETQQPQQPQDDNDGVGENLHTSSIANECFDAAQFPTLQADLKKHWDYATTTVTGGGPSDFDASSSASASASDGPNTNATTSPTATTTSCDQWFHRIYQQHNEQGRHYHTAVHLKEMLDYLQVLETITTAGNILGIRNPRSGKALRLATFFHDVVYDPQSNTNEEDSAKLFQEFAAETNANTITKTKDLEDGTITQLVVTLILATQHHQVILPNSTTTTTTTGTTTTTTGGSSEKQQQEQQDEESLQQIFLDLDMAVLAKIPQAYMAYAALIRQEYAFVPKDMYCEKRAAILTSFLQRPKIYLSSGAFTKSTHRTMEEQARQNLQSEIELLMQGKIPEENEARATMAPAS